MHSLPVPRAECLAASGAAANRRVLARVGGRTLSLTVSLRYHRAGVRKVLLKRLHAIWERAQSPHGLHVNDSATLEGMELLLRCCEVSVGHDAYNALPDEVKQAVRAPGVAFTGALLHPRGA